MIINQADKLNMKGHLSISKIHKDGSEEVVFDDKNVIVSGFGWGLSYMFSRMGSQVISDFQIDRFQLGVSGASSLQVSTTYELAGQLSSAGEYQTDSGDSNIYAFSSIQYKSGSTPTSVFGKIPFNKVTRINETSVRYSIFVDEDSCNSLSRDGADVPLNEIGLFMKNPQGSGTETSVLVAYKYFSNIYKTSDFGLLFRWTISFG